MESFANRNDLELPLNCGHDTLRPLRTAPKLKGRSLPLDHPLIEWTMNCGTEITCLTDGVALPGNGAGDVRGGFSV
ncbi:hypothetical protein NPIL_145481 [Nephila pilipes]|uniref:Uncharacterized protein n=1 Tax=Nephila pilipes TaxID=299642 RepID=A0A8X6NZ73_NEPPI|nr:hypothetical protein NPIL_145481 [Nephila pilipes]